MPRPLLCLLLVLSLTALGLPVAAQERIQPLPPHGAIHWGELRITAKGLGFAPDGTADSIQARRLAERAAVLDARRNLVEVLATVRVDAHTVVRDLMVQSDSAANRITGVLGPTRQDALRVLPDGGVEVQLSAPLQGGLLDALRQLAPPGDPAPAWEYRGAATPDLAPQYSGLVVDARGLDLVPSLRPGLYSEGRLLYPLAETPEETLATQGVAAYYPTPEAAVLSGRVGAAPLIVRAQGLLPSRADSLLLAPESVAALEPLAKGAGAPLLRCAVAIVY